MCPILVLHMAAEPVSVLADKTQIPAAEGLQRAAWCHQPHMLPMEELFGNAHQEKSTSRKQHTRWSFIFNLILIITRNSSSSFTRKVRPQCTNKLKEVLSINIWIHCLTATVSSERSVQETTAALTVTQSQSLVPRNLSLYNNSLLDPLLGPAKAFQSSPPVIQEGK